MNVSSLQLFHDGANSLLYYHEDPSTRTPCVVKVMKEGIGDASKVASFYNEYEIGKDLELEGVPRYFRKDQLDGKPAIVLSYISGQPLSALFNGKALALDLFVDVALQAAQILSQIHQNRIIHKDINANNIIFNPEDKKVYIIDLGISSNFDIRKQQLGNPEHLEGTLAYISPEQTGRMNRVVDYRTDLYSLGVTYYELLTGKLPFESSDSMELVHCHLARRPLPPCEVNSSIPEILSDIVMKLLEKSASDRYQSSDGLASDLQKCQEQLQTAGRLEAFELGEQDYSEKLQLSEKLYGCAEQEVVLVEAFRRVSEGAVELLLVKGYAGVGKSSLVAEVHGAITEKRGYFIRGKHDQYQRNTPYAAFIQAFDDWVDQILTENEEEIDSWKSAILNGLGEGAAVLVEVVPNLELILGKQAHAEKLSPAEAANRFNYLFRKFIQIISREDHPLVIFLDDLQWADAATLNSLKLLMTDKENKYLLIIGAYRNNEVSETHPLTFAIDDIHHASASINQLEVDNLSVASVKQFISDSLHTSPDKVEDLALLVHQKTQGNAFFVNQFLYSLHEEGFLYFSATARAWEWSLEDIKEQNITNNVVELMASKIEKLPDETQRILQLAACIGDVFDLSTLANAYGKSIAATFAPVWQAVEDGLLVPLDDNYKVIPALEASEEITLRSEFKFLHDRVQQAAYQLITEEKRGKLHYHIGKQLIEKLSEEEQKEHVFEIANHINIGKELIQDTKERLLSCNFNRLAAQKAKDATAYEAAYDYLKNALYHLSDQGWSLSYEESLLTYIEMAETAYLIGKKDEMDQYIEIVIANAQDPLDKVKAYEVKSQAHIANGEMEVAVENALQVLRLLGIKFPKKPMKIHVISGLIKLQWVMRQRSNDSILNAPKMEDLRVRAAVRILSSAAIAAYFADRTLYALFAIKQVLLSLKYGNAYTTPSAYASVAIIYTAVLHKYQRGYKFGDLALRLLKKRNAKKLQARIAMIFHGIISPWKRHTAMGLEPLKEGFQQGMDSGDFEYGLHSALEHILCGIYTGRSIPSLLETNIKFLSVARQLDQRDPRQVLQVFCQTLEDFSNPEKENPGVFEGSYYDEKTEYPEWVKDNSGAALASDVVMKTYIAVIFEQWHKADELKPKSDKYLQNIVGTVGPPMVNFSQSMCWAALALESSDPKKVKEYLDKVKANQKDMKVWAQNAPMNFEHRYLLIEAERAAIAKKDGRASRLFKRAIHLAQENDYPNDEALALERFANLCLRQDNRLVAGLYFRKAYLVYQKWGVKAKLTQLQNKYYELLLPEEIPNLTSTQVDIIEGAAKNSSVHNTIHTTRRFQSSSLHSSSSGSVNMLDFSSLLKASNALAQEVNLQSLQEKMLEITLENAGAQSGVFIQNSEEKGLIVAAGYIQGNEGNGSDRAGIVTGVGIAESTDVPRSMVNYVARTKKPLVLAHAAKDQTYSFDRYIKEQNCQSVMCFPVMSQGKLGGIIYLENNLVTNAFTEDRLEVLNMLSAQMGIALENATLYNNLEKKVEQRTEALNEKNQELEEQYQKTTDSIRYAQTIQEAMLPATQDFEDTFKDSFVLFRPKDIVSGDFYWMRRKGNSIYIAVADCTGHGVPGAFMSTIGVSLLDEILIEKGVEDPGLILELLNLGIRTGLRQDQTDNDDGMDVCLCAITPSEQEDSYKIKYSGAKRPLYYVTGEDGQIHQLKGTNKTIGGYFNKKTQKDFENYEIELKSGAAIYLSSDGYVDQSNTKHKKIGTPMLLELLLQNYQLQMKKQKDIMEKILDIHQEGVSQRDDITVIGLRL